MATAITHEHVETQARAEPAAVGTQHVEVRKVAIDGNTLSVLAVGIALFALAFGAFTHLSGRIDGLDAKIEKLSAEQRAENREINARLDAKIEQMATRTDDRFEKLNEKFDKLSAETNDKFERLNEKLTQIIINQSQGK